MVTDVPGSRARRPGILTVDLEDYRRQELVRQLGGVFPPHPAEVERQVHALLELFESIEAGATFFTVGRLAAELPRSIWSRFGKKHRIGCHGHEHLHVWQQGPRCFLADVRRAKAALEQTVAAEVISFRAPYFSSDSCDPWFGEMLAKAGFLIDSSRRLNRAPSDFHWTLPLTGSDGAVTEVPFPSIGFGVKRLTVIGGTYFRLLPLSVIRNLLSRGERQGFVPLIYLHTYDIDGAAPPLEFPGGGKLASRAADYMRRVGRESAGEKLRALADTYEFRPIESVLPKGAES